MVPRLVYPLEVSAAVRYRVHPKRGSQKVHTYFSFTHESEGKKTRADLKCLHANVPRRYCQIFALPLSGCGPCLHNPRGLSARQLFYSHSILAGREKGQKRKTGKGLGQLSFYKGSYNLLATT